MEKFTASNGYVIDKHHSAIEVTPSNALTKFLLHEDSVAALREFFLHERDQELGRWRWPENPDYVVYPVVADTVDVLRESSVSDESRGPGRQQSIARSAAASWVSPAAQNFYAAARAYFAAHPKPKPWHNAKPGEVWVFELVNGTECAATREYGPDFKLSYGNLMSPRDERIAAGRRIWPEVSDD